MFYFPTRLDQTAFEHLSISLSKRFMGFLIERGLNILVLPEGNAAEKLFYDVLRFEREPLFIGKMPHEHAHYHIARSTIVLPRICFENSEHNVVLHEIGHALDFLYWGWDRPLSDHPAIANALRKVPPLDFHCHEQDEKNQRNAEQFATSFEAFFNEPLAHNGKQLFHSIMEIDESFIGIMKRHFVEPFRD